MVKTINNFPSIQDKLKISSENLNINEFTTSIYNYEKILLEVESFAVKAKTFADKTHSSEASRHNYELACITVIPLLTIIALISYFRNKSILILVMSLLLLSLLIPTLIIEGFNTSQFIISIDMCKNINKHILTESNPVSGKGIGYYVSCPSKPVQVMINTARFELGNSFNNLFYDLKKYMSEKYQADLGNLKRNNTVFNDFADKYREDVYLQQGLYSIVYINDILIGLEGLITCELAEDMVNFTEEKFCYLNISYEFNNMIYFFLGIFGLLLLGIGINKLIVLLNPIYHNLGNKKEGMEVLNETG